MTEQAQTSHTPSGGRRRVAEAAGRRPSPLTLLAVAILARSRPELREKLVQFRKDQSAKVLAEKLP